MENKEPPRNLLSADIPYNDTKPIAGFGRPQPNLMMNPDTVSKIMRGIEIRPRLLEENARANMFPEVIHHIVVSMKQKIADQTLSEISTLEQINRQHNHSHTKSIVTDVKPITVQSIIPWGILQRDATLLSSEEWTLERKHDFDSRSQDNTKYRVNYYTSMGGDFYYSDVVPGTNKPSQWFDFAVSRIMRRLKWFQNRSGDVNEVVLQKPPSPNMPNDSSSSNGSKQ